MNKTTYGVKALTLLVVIGLVLGLASFSQPVSTAQASSQIELVGPAGSGQFGQVVLALPNGNLVVSDPGYDSDEAADVGAVYLYDGAALALISTLTGSTADDRIGTKTLPLGKGNFITQSSTWDNDAAVDAGAVTWCSGVTGCSGAVSSSNSLVGSSSSDHVGEYMDYGLLTNGNYLVKSPYWDNDLIANAGAVTWCSGASGCSGAVSPTNSLVGSTANDGVGYDPYPHALDNTGDYFVPSYHWDNGTLVDAGALTFCHSGGGCVGPVTPQNSLFGYAAGDSIMGV